MRTKWPFRAEPAAPLDDCARRCAAYLAEFDPRPDAARHRLVTALGTLLTAQAEQDRRTGSSAPAGRALFDALLAAGNRAVEAGGPAELDLALDLADAGLAVRRNSRGAWRLRALALEGLGRSADAAEAAARYAELAEGDPAAALLPQRVEAARERLAEAVGLLPADTDEARAFAAAVREQQPPRQVRAAFTAHVGAALRDPGPADPRARRLAELYAEHCRLLDQPPLADPLLGGFTPLGVWDLRNRIAGRPACVVHGRAPAGSLDDYGIVVRCDGFRAGERADVHVHTAGTTAGRQHPVPVRIVFGDPAEHWLRAVRQAVPGAQQHLGDESLRRPLTDPALLGEERTTSATTLFTALRLLDFLDVSPRLDLFGFAALRPAERDWVTSRATHSTETRTALR